MKDLFRFFGSKESSDPALELEFRRAYQEPSLAYLRLAYLFGIVGFTAFMLMDEALGSPSKWATILRVAIIGLFSTGLAFSYWRSDLAVRYYTPIVNAYSVLAMLSAAVLPVILRRTDVNAYWSIDTSLTLVVIVTYGFNRLTARNMAAVMVPGSVLGIASVFFLPTFDALSFARLVLHVAIVNAVAYYFRATLESRERSLFLLARDNLSKNIYAKELEVAREQADEGNEVKLRFLASMSHEFRTPMNAIVQTLEALSRDADLAGRRLIEQARASGMSLVATLNSILEYSNWTRKIVQAAPSPIGLSETLREVVERHRAPAEGRGLSLSLRLDLARSEDVVEADKVMLQQALSALLDNAVQFTDAGDVRVEVALRPRRGAAYPEAQVDITIADTGIGIAAELQELVFTPFYRVDDTSTRRSGGAGLGLAIARRLVEAMRGSVEMESELGIGTRVRVRFPARIYKTRSRPALEKSTVVGARLGRLNGAVLLAEDNDFNASLLAELLTLMGLEVERASDGEQAHRRASERRFDVILMDCQMPNMDGYEATERIRSYEQQGGNARVPIVALTANALFGDREKCIAAGMDDYLAKPYTANELRAKLVRWLPHPDRTGAEGRASAGRAGAVDKVLNRSGFSGDSVF